MIDLVGSIQEAMTGQNAAKDAIKAAGDLERYKRVIEATNPDLILEMGTCAGGSSLWYADNSNARVVTVDIDPKVQLSMWGEWKYRVYPIAGSSVDPVIVDEVKAQIGDAERIMVVLDSDHSAAHVAKELAVYAPLVTPGCYLVCEDTLVRWLTWTGYVGSPLDAVEAFLAEHGGDWLVDMELEDFSPTTQHPGGWLRRLR